MRIAGWFLVESTPYALLKPQLETLSAGLAPHSQGRSGEMKSLLRQRHAQAPAKSTGAQIKLARADIAAEPGVVLDYLIVTTHILNLDFGYGGKSGLAAAGQTSGDGWNTYYCDGCDSGSLSDLYWSDWMESTVGIVVSNAPGIGYNPLCLDSMCQYFVHSANNAHATVTITNLPADEYDIFVYATRASDVGAPVIELKRGATSLQTKGTTRWGNGWYSSAWEEGEQYVRFRKIAVTNQSLTLDSYPDAAGYGTFSGIQIVPSAALPVEQPNISKLINVNFGGDNDTNKLGAAAAGLATNDFWNVVSYPYSYAVSVANLKWSSRAASTVGMMLLNASGIWGMPDKLSDPMLRCYKYPSSSGNITMVITNLPTGNCNFYLYSPASVNLGQNTIFELWTGEVNCGIKGTTLRSLAPSTNQWEQGQQYVLFEGVAVSSNTPVTIHVKHGPDGYALLSGMQIACTGEADTDADGLPDAWELKWFGNLDQTATDDPDGDGLSNLREYQLGFDPNRADSDGDGINDGRDNPVAWMDDAPPQGAFLYANSETWNWLASWSDGTGWGGATVYPITGAKMHVSANVDNNLHQHYFERAAEVMRPGTGDVLYAYVNLDSTYPPAEVMLQFYVLESNGSYSREHRVYWGANNINSGVNGTASRYCMGPLPATGQWVRLTVPASVVDLQGKIIEGMNFTLWGGRAAWDSAGRIIPDLDGDGIPDLDGDGLPDPWEQQHFGNLDQTADGDYDGDGVSNLAEFNAGTDPNTIKFLTMATNKYVNSISVPVEIAVLGGVPSSLAVLVDSTNYAAANWTGYGSSNLIVDLGTTNEGWHEVRIGLRGRLESSEQAWEKQNFKLDTTPPEVVITNPVETTISRPIIQLQGYASESLGLIDYDLTNAAGVWTNEQGFVTRQFFDTNLFENTTSYWQCYDVELTNGINTITLRISDLAGNVTTTNLSLTLDYSGDSNAPAISLIWPQDGMQISGTNFTLRGRLDDETARVSAWIVDPNGNTNTLDGLVERGGMFWVEPLPLTNGNNVLTVMATDAAGNVATTNITVSQSTLVLTIDSTPSGEDLYQARGGVSGTVSDPSYSVSVNGVEATVDEYGNWTAENVPILGRGTATFDAAAYAAGSGGGSPPSANKSLSAELPPKVAFANYFEQQSLSGVQGRDSFLLFETKNYTEQYQPNTNGGWLHCYYGTFTQVRSATGGSTTHEVGQWSDEDPGGTSHLTDSDGGDNWLTNMYWLNLTVPGWDFSWMWLDWPHGQSYYYVCHYSGQGVHHHWDEAPGYYWDVTLTANTQLKLYTGGKALLKRKSLFCITGGATRYEKPAAPFWLYTPEYDVPPQSVKVLGKSLGADNRLWIVLPDNSEQDLGLTAPPDHYDASASAEKYTPYITANGMPLDPDTASAEFCVGQKINFIIQGIPCSSANPRWNFSGDYINDHYTGDAGCEIYQIAPYWVVQNPTRAWYKKDIQNATAYAGLYCAFDNGQTAFVTAEGMFKVHRPSLTPLADSSVNRFEASWLKLNLFPGVSFQTCVDTKYPGMAGFTGSVKLFL